MGRRARSVILATAIFAVLYAAAIYGARHFYPSIADNFFAWPVIGAAIAFIDVSIVDIFYPEFRKRGWLVADLFRKK